ncbi:hypothetical protein [Vibrio parahaemolyticus]|uniref:hypothetical protein n=1 Tax=Vibrio parahaemolyticus TaxID=670 RepID=UPI00235F2C3C|nr:hypothetical protein [Vibrio parahaemolyticus]
MKYIIPLLALFIGGCSTYSSNMRVGNSMDYVSLDVQREALTTVKQFDTIPQDAVVIGTVDAARCHRSFMEKNPSDHIVLNDLKVAAYSQGADGIADVLIEHESGLTKNCWMIVDAQAVMFMLKESN